MVISSILNVNVCTGANKVIVTRIDYEFSTGFSYISCVKTVVHEECLNVIICLSLLYSNDKQIWKILKFCPKRFFVKLGA